jgi:hypothetical protein
MDGRGAASRRKKKERKRTTNLGPRIRVLRIAPVMEAATPASEGGPTGEPAENAMTDVKVPKH